MPIVVKHDPNIGLVGRMGDLAGKGQYRKWKAEFDQRNEQFKQQINQQKIGNFFQGLSSAWSIGAPILQMQHREQMLKLQHTQAIDLIGKKNARELDQRRAMIPILSDAMGQFYPNSTREDKEAFIMNAPFQDLIRMNDKFRSTRTNIAAHRYLANDDQLEMATATYFQKLSMGERVKNGVMGKAMGEVQKAVDNGDLYAWSPELNQRIQEVVQSVDKKYGRASIDQRPLSQKVTEGVWKDNEGNMFTEDRYGQLIINRAPRPAAARAGKSEYDERSSVEKSYMTEFNKFKTQMVSEQQAATTRVQFHNSQNPNAPQPLPGPVRDRDVARRMATMHPTLSSAYAASNPGFFREMGKPERAVDVLSTWNDALQPSTADNIQIVDRNATMMAIRQGLPPVPGGWVWNEGASPQNPYSSYRGEDGKPVRRLNVKHARPDAAAQWNRLPRKLQESWQNWRDTIVRRNPGSLGPLILEGSENQPKPLSIPSGSPAAPWRSQPPANQRFDVGEAVIDAARQGYVDLPDPAGGPPRRIDVSGMSYSQISSMLTGEQATPPPEQVPVQPTYPKNIQPSMRGGQPMSEQPVAPQASPMQGQDTTSPDPGRPRAEGAIQQPTTPVHDTGGEPFGLSPQQPQAVDPTTKKPETIPMPPEPSAGDASRTAIDVTSSQTAILNTRRQKIPGTKMTLHSMIMTRMNLESENQDPKDLLREMEKQSRELAKVRIDATKLTSASGKAAAKKVENAIIGKIAAAQAQLIADQLRAGPVHQQVKPGWVILPTPNPPHRAVPTSSLQPGTVFVGKGADGRPALFIIPLSRSERR